MKGIVSVIGRDKKGIIAKVSTALFDMGINIENISQSIMQEYFAMIMAVDMCESSFDFNEISEKLIEVGKNNGVEIHIQLQSIFDAMHQVSTNVNSTPNS